MDRMERRSTDTITTWTRSTTSTTFGIAKETLEVFMDKLSMWQLVAHIDLSGKLCDIKHERYWMQIFCKNIIKPQHKAVLSD